MHRLRGSVSRLLLGALLLATLTAVAAAVVAARDNGAEDALMTASATTAPDSMPAPSTHGSEEEPAYTHPVLIDVPFVEMVDAQGRAIRVRIAPIDSAVTPPDLAIQVDVVGEVVDSTTFSGRCLNETFQIVANGVSRDSGKTFHNIIQAARGATAARITTSDGTEHVVSLVGDPSLPFSFGYVKTTAPVVMSFLTDRDAVQYVCPPPSPGA